MPTEIRNYESPPNFDNFSRKKVFRFTNRIDKRSRESANFFRQNRFCFASRIISARHQRFFGNNFHQSDIALAVPEGFNVLYCAAMDDSKKEIITNLLRSNGFRSQPHTNPAILEFARRTAGISAEICILDYPLSFPVRITANGENAVRNLNSFGELLDYLENRLSLIEEPN